MGRERAAWAGCVRRASYAAKAVNRGVMMTDNEDSADHRAADRPTGDTASAPDSATDSATDTAPTSEQAVAHPVDGPTVMGPHTGHLTGPDPTADDQTVAPPAPEPPPPSAEPTVATTDQGWHSERPAMPDEPTISVPRPHDEITVAEPTLAATHSPVDEPTLAAARPPVDGPTVAVPRPGEQPTDNNLTDNNPTGEQPTGEQPIDGAATDDEATVAVGADEVTTTGPTVAGWPFGEPEPPPPAELIWRTDPPPASRAPGRSPGYYIALGAVVVLVVGLVAAAAVAAVVKPMQAVAGTAVPTQGIPEITTTTTAPPAPTSTSAPQSADPLAEVAKHPLSTWQGRMADATCSLPRFDLADDRQAAFYDAAKVCADTAWRDLLTEADLPGDVRLVTVTKPVQTPSCGEVTPTSPATQCDGTVYLTPAHLRDTEQNGRYPGRYLGVFLREYARALQFTSGLAPLVGEVDTGSAEDLDKRLAQQATCLAGVASGAMAGRGAVDANITGEISARLTTVDAPPDAKAWLDKGFQARQPSACNTWT